MIKICKECRKEFKTWYSKQIFCSRKCQGISQRVNKIKKCFTCGKEFYCPPSQIGKFCSQECHNKYKIGKPPWCKGLTKKTDKRLDFYRPTIFKKGRIAPKGKEHPSWKGGKIHRQGYKLVLNPNKPYRYMMEHRLIMEQHLGRPLTSNEIIHHINGIKTDNRIENLEIVLKKTHLGQVICPYCSKKFAIK